MNAFKLFSFAALAVLVGAAHADEIRIAVPDGMPAAAPTPTRAEVAADLQIWRLAGLQALTQREESPFSPDYRNAQARYESLRASPQFAQLVAEIARRPDVTVRESKSTVGALVFTSATRPE